MLIDVKPFCMSCRVSFFVGIHEGLNGSKILMRRESGAAVMHGILAHHTCIVETSYFAQGQYGGTSPLEAKQENPLNVSVSSFLAFLHSKENPLHFPLQISCSYSFCFTISCVFCGCVWCTIFRLSRCIH